VFVVCMGKQSESVFCHCDLGRAKSFSTRGSGQIRVPGSYECCLLATSEAKHGMAYIVCPAMRVCLDPEPYLTM